MNSLGERDVGGLPPGLFQSDNPKLKNTILPERPPGSGRHSAAVGRGGGGHRQAAGFGSDLSIKELIAFLRKEFVAKTSGEAG